MDQKVLEAQQWLNSTYGNNPDFDGVNETGVTGTATFMALVEGLQIELQDIDNTLPITGIFGDKTKAVCPTLTLNSAGNIVTILQHGLFCKGYNPISVTGKFNQNTINAILKLQSDAGLSDAQKNEDCTPLILQAVLSTEYYQRVSKGDPKIREMQQYLNSAYLNYIGIRPCDGIYSRSTNEALIYALQAEEGMSTTQANGWFGNGAKEKLPIITSSTTGKTGFIRIIQYALYCNVIEYNGLLSTSRYNPGSFNGNFDEKTQEQVKNFKAFYGLNAVSSTVDTDAWMALLVSTGNPDRPVTACDCATCLTKTKAAALYNKGYRYVGRYLTGTYSSGGKKIRKNLTYPEIKYISNAGLKLFMIYQDDREHYANGNSDISNYFTYEQGKHDAEVAFAAANGFGIPKTEIIYFAVDYDFTEDQVKSKVIPYFQGINDYSSPHFIEGRYRIGIYSARNTCILVSNEDLSCSSFVSDLSRGYSGNMGFPLPDNWAFDQIKEDPNFASNDGNFAVDYDAHSGRYNGFNLTDLSPADYAIFNNNGTVCVNMYNAIPVYTVSFGSYVGGTQLGEIPKNGFYNLLKLPQDAPHQNTRYVYFRDRDGNFNGGFISIKNLIEKDEWKNSSIDFRIIKFIKNNSGEYVAERNEKTEDEYYIFETNAPLKYLDISGNTEATLPSGSKIAIDGSFQTTAAAGLSYPYTIKVVKKMLPGSNSWTYLAGGDYGFLSLGYEIGVLPNDRAIV